KKMAVLFLSILIFPFSYADTLKAGRGVEILALDGQKLKADLFATQLLDIAAGTHQVVVKYAKSFRNKEMIYSKPYIFNLDVIGETTIAVRNFSSQMQAEKEIKRGLTWIVTNAQKTRNVSDSDRLSGEGFMPYKDIEKLIRKYNQEKGIYLGMSATGEVKKALQQQKTQQLMQLYQSATKAQQKAFRIWLFEQNLK
ncbi:MAG: DUF2057 domain-containing protein, partial [Psychromonas sp.]|nr:DUF2057 domain-containing protein [Psychromonas sp.]